MARLREKRKTGLSPEEMRRALGIPTNLKPVHPREIRQRMLAEGVRPEERLASSEIIRMREE